MATFECYQCGYGSDDAAEWVAGDDDDASFRCPKCRKGTIPKGVPDPLAEADVQGDGTVPPPTET